MRQFLLMTALACTSLLCAAPEQAEAQVFWRPWLRPRVVFVPPRIIASVGGPTIFAAPQVVLQPNYPPPYYYPPPQTYVQPLPPPPVYVQPAPPPVYAPPPPVYVQPAPPPPPPVYVQPAPPPPVYVQPAPPPPPVYVQPAPPPPPVYAQPAPPPPPPSLNYYRPTVAPRSQWAAKFGIGGRFAGTINTGDGNTFGQLGFGGEILYRIHRRVVMELAGEYQKRVDSGFDRYDVPVTLGVRLHIGAPDWVVSPYFVAAAGGVYSDLDYLRSRDKAWLLDGQLGGGIEIRLGRHFAITADVRLDARHRLTKPDDATAATVSINGKPFSPIGDSYGGQFRLGAALYF